MDARQKMKDRIKQIPTPTILESLKLIGGGNVSTEKTIVRAYLLDEYEAREGEAAVDALMDSLKM